MTPPLEPPDTHYVNAVTGWLMLGNVKEARAEFSQIRAALRMHPAVLDLEWSLLAREGRWLAAAEVGERLVQNCPEEASAWVHRSYALHELHRTREAFDQLLPAATRFPGETIIPYNLACYLCQLDELPEARRWLNRALAALADPQTRAERVRSALADADLKPLWPELKVRLAVLRDVAG